MSTPTFWRDDALPFLEARAIADGRGICYAKHSHETFSIGSITGGESVYLNGRVREHVGAGTVVLMNPGDVHACNPLGEQPWSYRMFHVDSRWLAAAQGRDAFQPYAAAASHAPGLFARLEALYATCIDAAAGTLEKHGAALDFFTSMHDTLQPAPAAPLPDHQVRRAAEYLRAHRAGNPTLDDLCGATGLSPSYLIRAFKARYGMTPHAWLVDCRIQYCREQLRRGRPIADVALEAGFADQAHLQRAFKRHVAATPGQYRKVR
ncbi:AraC family transcriptional regulator [Pseudoduganella umbonata]|uniref:AraC family transcriptional regulator n=1 Tax=Pseudoduganella umbonata TaxID=864828 RepID=A0A4P8HPE8_9BURK|nr:AraC family transcriptional regulator [Pseudoduganella umbonata]MBB3221137.1 AraC-like DNA-binding protein [Pseudoduganella umbonata]QCP10330.1 AraC family transcriptional regulator [Pseudoduganella umbonata]